MKGYIQEKDHWGEKLSIKWHDCGSICLSIRVFVWRKAIWVLCLWVLPIKIWRYYPNVESFWLISTLNPDRSICMDSGDSPRLTMVLTFWFTEYTFFPCQDFITHLIISVDLRLVFLSSIVISLILPVFSYFTPVSKERDVKKHIPTKNSCSWRGFEYGMVGGTNNPSCICKKISNVIRT